MRHVLGTIVLRGNILWPLLHTRQCSKHLTYKPHMGPVRLLLLSAFYSIRKLSPREVTKFSSGHIARALNRETAIREPLFVVALFTAVNLGRGICQTLLELGLGDRKSSSTPPRSAAS